MRDFEFQSLDLEMSRQLFRYIRSNYLNKIERVGLSIRKDICSELYVKDDNKFVIFEKEKHINKKKYFRFIKVNSAKCEYLLVNQKIDSDSDSIYLPTDLKSLRYFMDKNPESRKLKIRLHSACLLDDDLTSLFRYTSVEYDSLHGDKYIFNTNLSLLYNPDGLTFREVPYKVLNLLERFISRYEGSEQVVKNIYMEGDSVRVRSWYVDVNSAELEYNRKSELVTDMPFGWQNLFERVVQEYENTGVEIHQIFLVINNGIVGKSYFYRESNGEYSAIFF